MSLHWTSLQQQPVVALTDSISLIHNHRLPLTMIGQHKRSLEHALSSKPVKCQRHSDDKLCDVRSRVPSLTDEKPERRKGFAEELPSKAYFPGNACMSAVKVKNSCSSELHIPAGDGDMSELRNVQPVDGVASRVLKEQTAQSLAHMVPGAAHELSEQNLEVILDDDSDLGTGNVLQRSHDRQGNEAVSTASVRCFSIRGNNEAGPLQTGKIWIARETQASDHLDPPAHPQAGEHTSLSHAAQAARHSSNGSSNESLHGYPERTNETHPTRRPEASSPVFIGDQTVELTRLNDEVERYGGYEIVTSEGLWARISAVLGLDHDCGPGLKLIHFKYLKAIGKHDGGVMLERLTDSKQTWSKSSVGVKLENLSQADDEEFAESDPLHEKHGEIGSRSSSSRFRNFDQSEGDHSEGEIGRVSGKRGAEQEKLHNCHTGDDDRLSRPLLGNCSLSKECQDIPVVVQSDYRHPKDHGIDDLAAFAAREVLTANVGPNASILERERRTLADMVKWIKRVALEPGNEKMGVGIEGTGENETWASGCASLAWKFRSMLWKRKEDSKPGDANVHQGRQVPAPSQYYEASPRQEQQGLERLRVTRERVAHYGFCASQKPLLDSLNSFKSSSPSPCHLKDTLTGQHLPRQSYYCNDERSFDDFNDRPRKRVPIGPDFQVCIPSSKFLGRSNSTTCSYRSGEKAAHGSDEEDSEDDEDESRWLGKRVWPPPGGKRSASMGECKRKNLCSCTDPDSIDCVRRHITEDRNRLHFELDQAFYIWKFDQLGEFVAEQWTRDEERIFKELVKMNPPSQDKNFWELLPEAFPGKKWSDFVSYYFNVFILRRRAVQNRLEVKHIDSDDDETELPEGLSEDSEEYESDDEVDDEPYEDGSDEEYIATENGIMGGTTYGSDTSSKLLDDHRFGAVGVNAHSRNVDVHDEAHARTPMSLRLYYSGREYIDRDLEDRNIGLLSAHSAAKWSYGEHLSEDKHADDHAGEYELQEVKSWEASHWDETDLDDDHHAHVPLATKGMNFKSEHLSVNVTAAPDAPSNGSTAEVMHHPLAANSCEREVWDASADITTSIKEKDKLLSTNGMIQEFFGSEI